MNANLISGILIALFISSIGIILAKPWELPTKRIEKWKRSLINGLFTALAVCIGFYMIAGEINFKRINIEQLVILGGLLLCFGLPIGVIATIGFYFGYRQLNWLYERKRKIINRSNDTRK